MSPITVGLDGLLIMLLLITLFIGLRLNARLKGLRADHAGFAKAVGELDQALIRAQAGLAELRTASTQAQSALNERLQDAMAAGVKLEQLIAKASAVPAPAPRLAPAPSPVAHAEQPLELRAPADPIRLEPRRDPRSRARVDEDLFDTGLATAPAQAPEPAAEAFPRLRFAAGGRR